jgi:hypothetical protein
VRNSKIIFTISLTLLTTASFIMTHAHAARENMKRKTMAVSAYYQTAEGVWQTYFSGGSGSFFSFLNTNDHAGPTAKIRTTNGTHILYSVKTATISHQLYYVQLA